MQDKRRLETRPKITKLHQYGKEAGDKHNKPKEIQESKTLYIHRPAKLYDTLAK
jgi:hypothetical protein